MISESSQEAEAHDRAQPLHKTSGGEIPAAERQAWLTLRDIIEREPDVHRLHALHWLPDEMQWLYLIETTFATFPRFVIASTDPANLAPDILFQSAAEWSAQAEWDELTRKHRI